VKQEAHKRDRFLSQFYEKFTANDVFKDKNNNAAIIYDLPPRIGRICVIQLVEDWNAGIKRRPRTVHTSPVVHNTADIHLTGFLC